METLFPTYASSFAVFTRIRSYAEIRLSNIFAIILAFPHQPYKKV